MAQAKDQRRSAREYLRVSNDQSGRERSNDEQTSENREEWAPELRFVGEPYRDAISASRYAGKKRDDWPRLVDDIKTGRFGAEVLVLWESSRGSRRNSEWAWFLELCRDHGVNLAVTEEGRIFDLHRARDMRDMQRAGADNEYESAKTSRRLKRAMSANAKAGRPHGRIPFGYRSVYDERTGQLLGRELDPEEAPVVVEMFDRIVRGHSLRRIAQDLEHRGIKTKYGNPWRVVRVRDTVRNRLYIGERVNAPGATSEDRRRGGNGVTYVPAEWPALVDRGTYFAVQRILSDPSRKTQKNRGDVRGWRPGKALHLLSGIARCDICSGPLTVYFRYDRRSYHCNEGRHIAGIDADDLERIATNEILSFLASPENVNRLSTDDDHSKELDGVRSEIAEIRHALADLTEQMKRRQISASMAGATEAHWLAELQAAETRERELATPSTLRSLIEPGKEVEARWMDAPIETRRELTRMLLVPDIVGEMRLTHGKRGHRVPVQDRLRWLVSTPEQ